LGWLEYVLTWFEELLRVLSLILCHALLAAPLHLTRCRKTFFTADYLANLPANTDLRTLAAAIKARWICEQAHQQMQRRTRS
jgi:hypothetical protein